MTQNSNRYKKILIWFLIKLEIHKNNFEQVEKQHQLELQSLQKDYKENKEKVVEYIIDHVMSVTLVIPDNIQKFTKNFKKD